MYTLFPFCVKEFEKMNVVDLIEAAQGRAGTLGEVAKQLKKPQSRISEWKKGKGKPSAGDIACMAKLAGLPVLITVAMVESDLHPETAPLWEAALGEARAPAYWSRLGADCALC